MVTEPPRRSHKKQLPVSPRAPLLAVLATMPEEAFGYLVLSIAGMRGPIWPDGLGGFKPESRASIEAATAAAKQLADPPQGPSGTETIGAMPEAKDKWP